MRAHAWALGFFAFVAIQVSAPQATAWPWDDKYSRARKCEELIEEGSKCVYRVVTPEEGIEICKKATGKPGLSSSALDWLCRQSDNPWRAVCFTGPDGVAYAKDKWWGYKRDRRDECQLFLFDFRSGRVRE